MPKYRMVESNGASGEVPEYGAIFMSNSSTSKECLRRELFGLPMGQAGFVKQVKAGMLLFLFEFESRELHGVFQACSDGAINIDPNAFCSSGKQFPAQVKFTEKWRCRPLGEREFRHAISDNYFTAAKFNFGLSKAQVQRLLKLFSLRKVERSRLRKTAVANPTRKSESRLGNTAGDCSFRNRRAKETDGEVDREFPFRGTSGGDILGHRLTENDGFGDESAIGVETKENEYSEDAYGVCRRLVRPKLHGSKDRLGYNVSMNNSSRTDALTKYSDYSIVNDESVLKNLRQTTSGWLKNDYHEKDGITHASSWPNHEEHLNFEADLVVPVHSSVHLESAYGTNTEYYDPCEPGIMRGTTMKSSRHDIGAHKIDSMGLPSFAANSDYMLREEIIPVGGYGSDTLLSETAQPFPNEHNDTSVNKNNNLALDYYIPMPTEHPKYQTNGGMIGVACSETDSESRFGQLHHSQVPGFLTSAGVTENMRNSERLSYSSRSIVPSFAYPLSSRDLSPKDGVNYEISAYQHQEELGCHASYSNDRVARDSRIHPSFAYPSKSGGEMDMYLENRTQNKIQAYQQHEEFGDDAFDSNDSVIRMKEAYQQHSFGGDAFDSNDSVIPMKDHVNPAELERKRTRKSVFSRLAMPAEEREAEKDSSPDSESVGEVMAFLNDCHKYWVEQKRPNMTNRESFGKLKKKKGKIYTKEVLDNDLMVPFSETSTDGLLDCEENMEHSKQKRAFIDFKRRSKAQKSSGSPTEGCSKDSPGQSAPQNKKRKLRRPKLIEDDSEKDRGNNDNPTENVLASQSASKVPASDLLGRGDQ